MMKLIPETRRAH